MNQKIDLRWQNYCQQLKKTAADLTSKGESFEDILSDDLHQFVSKDPPLTEIDFENRIQTGDQLMKSWERLAYQDCKNHESMVRPTETAAEQAESARSQPDSNSSEVI